MILILLVARNAFANVIGSDLQNFCPTTNGLDFVTVQSANTLEPGVINMGMFFNDAVNTLPYFAATNTKSAVNFNDNIVGLDLGVGVGIMKDWDIGLTVPSVIAQTVSSDVAHGEFENVGITEIRPNTKYRLLGNTQRALAAVLSANFPLIQDDPYTGESPGPIFNFELAAHTTLDRVVLGADFGYRKRNAGTPVVSQGIRRLAIS